MAEMKRAYSVLDIKSFDEDQRIIRGIATTPQTDLQDDIVEPQRRSVQIADPVSVCARLATADRPCAESQCHRRRHRG